MSSGSGIMADKFSSEVRSKIMSRIRSKNTKPEKILMKELSGLRLRYQPNIQGKPDFGLKSKKIAIFIDGCFWHKCKKCFKTPKSNKKYWIPKLDRNVKRAKQLNRNLRKEGYLVIRIWEHQINKNSENVALKSKRKISKFLN